MSRSQAPRRWDRVVNLSIITVLLMVAALTHGAVFEGIIGYRAALGGVLLGVLTAWVCARWRLGLVTSIIVPLGVFLVGAGPLAQPERGLLPTPQVLGEVLIGAVSSWKDLLTVQVPVAGGNTVLMPVLAAMICSYVAVTLALRSNRPLTALIPVAVLLLTGVYWGGQRAPFGSLIGGVVGLLSWWWVIRCLNSQRRQLATVIRLSADTSSRRSRGLVGAVVLVCSAMLVGLASSLLLPAPGHRVVLRDSIEITLDVRHYASPVVTYRLWRTTAAETELFTVDGAMGPRIRLATMDSYDGTVFGIGSREAESSFKKVGTTFTDIPLAAGETTSTAEIAISGYTGHWVVGGGQVRSLLQTGPRASELQDTIYYSQGLETVLSTTPITSGDSYQITVVDPVEVPDSVLQDRAIVQVPMPADINVPDAVAIKAQQLTEGASTGFEQVRRLQQQLSSQGFYSDGTDGLSRPGHRTDRLEQFLTGEYMIGDDDQFAPAMVLMLRSLGIPSRLAMGFQPDSTDQPSISVTGKDVRLWVEVPFEGIGWVPFDPTPPRDQTIRTQVPTPRPQPQPQVLQPPDPPEKPGELPPEELSEVDDSRDDPPPAEGWWVLALKIVGVIAVILSPLLLLLAIKALRSWVRRRRGSPEVRSVGAWAELIDRARELGLHITPGLPRNHQAVEIDQQLWAEESSQALHFQHYGRERSDLGRLAERIDCVVFGPQGVDAEYSKSIWHDQRSVLRRMRGAVSWSRRLGAALSLRTLRSRWASPEPPAKPAMTDRSSTDGAG